MIIAPSVLALDYSKLNEQTEILNKYSSWLHFDVMDGHFVKNLSFGPDVFKAFRKLTSCYLDVHIMVEDPFYYADVFADCGADGITFHFEALNNDINKSLELIEKIKSKYLKAGISIKPNTNIQDIEPLLKEVDLVLIMSVEPGFGGQEFMNSTYEKIEFLDKYKKENNLSYLIQVDGGINDRNSYELSLKGADVLVSGSFIFDGDIKNNIDKLLHASK